MKNLLRSWPCAAPATTLAVCLIAAAPGTSSAAPTNSARITQLANEVRILPTQGPARPAAVNDTVSPGAVLRTAADSRVELTSVDGLLARVNENSNLRFAGRDALEFGDGAILVHVPKGSGTTAIRAEFGNVSTSGATVALELLKPPSGKDATGQSVARYRVSVVEGEVELRSNDDTNQVIKLTAGQAAIGSSGEWPGKVVRFDVAEWTQRNSLVSAFRPLPADVLALIGTPAPARSFAALFRTAGFDASGMSAASLGTINPANLSNGRGNEVSPSEERMTICHNGQTLTIPRDAAERHLRNHRDDSAGACR